MTACEERRRLSNINQQVQTRRAAGPAGTDGWGGSVCVTGV